MSRRIGHRWYDAILRFMGARMHKTIWLTVATVVSFGMGTAIIWQTERGWGTNLASARTPITEKDFYDAPPVQSAGLSPMSLFASHGTTTPPSQTVGLPAQPQFPERVANSDAQTSPSPSSHQPEDLWNVFAINQPSVTTPPTQNQTAPSQPENAWAQFLVNDSDLQPAQLQSVVHSEPPVSNLPPSQSEPATDPWQLGGVTQANQASTPQSHQQPIELTGHESSSPHAPTDPFTMHLSNNQSSEEPQRLPGAHDSQDSMAVMSLFPDPVSTPQSPAPGPTSQPAVMFPDHLADSSNQTAPNQGNIEQPTPVLWPDFSEQGGADTQTPIRLTQAEQPPTPTLAQPQAPDPIPLQFPNESPAQPAVNPFTMDFSNPPAQSSPLTPLEPLPSRQPAPADAHSFPGIENSPTNIPSSLSPTPFRNEPVPTTDDKPMMGVGVVSRDVPRIMQRPELSLEKIAPSTAALGEAMIYTIEVKNTGTIPAKDVTLEDQIPKGTELTGTIPQAHLKDKTLVWKLGTLQPGDSKLVKVRVIPHEEGDVGSVATVHFMTEVAAQTRITAPVLELVMDAIPQVAVGENATVKYTVRNVGEGTAFDVTLYSLIPANFKHPEGTDLEMPIGTLDPGQSKEVTLVALAEQPGRVTNEAHVDAKGGITAQARTDIEVIDSVLTVERTGPARRFVGHNANYTITVANQSIRDIEQATIVETIPNGMEFISATSNGRYNPSTRSVSWAFSKLRQRSQESMQLTLKPNTVGDWKSTVDVVTKDGHKASVAATTIVEGFASLKIEDPEGRGLIAVGEQVSLRFKVRNRGSAPANEVKLSCVIPSSFQLIKANGPTSYRQEGNRVVFDSVQSIAPDQDMQVDFVLAAVAAGTAHLSIAVNAEEMKDPLTHEENVVVYNPNE